jgi:phage terminase large subunit-like protein
MQKTCKEILDGVKHDDAQFALIYELDEDDDWTDSSTWIKANPSLGVALRPAAIGVTVTASDQPRRIARSRIQNQAPE